MRTFKFFSGDWQRVEELPRPVLENEQTIRYYNDEDFQTTLHSRVIAWARGIHLFADNWIPREYEGTFERFFYNRLEIPVIQSIQAIMQGGSTLTEDDREYIDNNNFYYPVRIIYYEYETI